MTASLRADLAAHLGPSLSLSLFRSMLDGLSRPGTVGRLDELPDGLPPALALAAAICDLDQRVAVLASVPPGTDGRLDWAAALGAATGARTAPTLHDADVVVALRPPTTADVARLRVGSAHAPEDGARLLIGCTAVRTDGPADTVLTVQGPGAREPRRFGVDGVDGTVFDAVQDANRRYPAGIDTWCVGDDRSLVAVSRSSSILRLRDQSLTGSGN